MEVLIAIALVAIAVGVWWVALSRPPAPPPPAPAPAPAPGPVSLLPPDLQEELEEAARDRREAFAEWRAARMRREAHKARREASDPAPGTGSDGSVSAPPTEGGNPPAPASAPAAHRLRGPRRRTWPWPWGERHLAQAGEVVRFRIPAERRTAGIPLFLLIEVERQERDTGTWFNMCKGRVVDIDVLNHLRKCPTCKAAYGLK